MYIIYTYSLHTHIYIYIFTTACTCMWKVYDRSWNVGPQSFNVYRTEFSHFRRWSTDDLSSAKWTQWRGLYDTGNGDYEEIDKANMARSNRHEAELVARWWLFWGEVRGKASPVGGLEHVFYFFHILGRILPTDELIFFRGVGQPPTRSKNWAYWPCTDQIVIKCSEIYWFWRKLERNFRS